MKMLFVEDYAPLLESVTKALREQGWAVDSAKDGDEGRWLALNETYDVVILDVMLPGVSGLEILKEMRERGIETPTLILSALDEVDHRMRGLDSGADDYLVKPFFVGELISRLRALMRRAYRQLDPTLRFHGLELDTSRREVRKDGVSIELTAREYGLLEYLARQKGRLVTRSQIWDHVYEYHGGAGSNVVDVYVGYLRRKLRQCGIDGVIETRRGQGYWIPDGD